METVLVIGIAGGSGSGKTTLAENIINHFDDRISLLRHDDYYKCQDHLLMSERVKTNYDHPHAFDTDLLIYHIDELRAGRDILAPTYDYTKHTRAAETRAVKASKVVLLEGILILENPELRDKLDMKIYVDTDADVRILRRLLRDVKERGRSLDSVIGQYLETKAAAFTMMLCGATAAPLDEIDFVLVRPFVFIINGYDGLPLFIGTVNNLD